GCRYRTIESTTRAVSARPPPNGVTVNFTTDRHPENQQVSRRETCKWVRARSAVLRAESGRRRWGFRRGRAGGGGSSSEGILNDCRGCGCSVVAVLDTVQSSGGSSDLRLVFREPVELLEVGVEEPSVRVPRPLRHL